MTRIPPAAPGRPSGFPSGILDGSAAQPGAAYGGSMSRLAPGHRPGFPAGIAEDDASRRGPACGGPASKLALGRPSGFATILVLLLVFLMLMLALIYLRTMRAYIVGHPDLTGNAGAVCDQLEGDLAKIIGTDGQIGGANPCEPYDYPWTCARMNAPCQLLYPQMVSSTQGLGDPCVDDAWLAPLEPSVLPGGADGWSQVSNVAGSFLAYDNAALSGIAGHPATGLPVPQDVPAGATIAGLAGAAASGQAPTAPASRSLAARFQNVPLTDPRLVDADGDGVPDSLWFYPRNSLQGNLRYVAAVRIVDLSGMLNVNTALGEAQFSLAPETLPDGSGKLPRKGEGPYEIDASSLLGAMPASALAFRQTQPPAPGTLTPLSPLNSWTLWLAGAASTDKLGEPYGDVPSKSGTRVNADSATRPSVRQGLRYDLNDELALRDFSNRFGTGALAPSPAPILGSHYPAFNLAAVNPQYPACTSFSSLAADLRLRGKVSTLGGACDMVAGVPVKGGAAAAIRPCAADACQAAEGRPFISGGMDSNFVPQGVAGVCSTLFQGVDPTNPKAAYPYPKAFADGYDTGTLKFTAGLMNGRDLPSAALQYAQQAGAAWADALDNDSLATGASNWLGHDPAPVLTEVYLQMPYWVVSAPVANADGTYAVTYGNSRSGRTSSPARTGSYAFEVANPYPMPVRLDNVRFRMATFNGTMGGTYTAGICSYPLETYVATAEASASGSTGLVKDAAGKWVLKPGERLIFYRIGVEAAPVTYAFSGSSKVDLTTSGILPASSATVHVVNLGTAAGAAGTLDLDNASVAWTSMSFEVQTAMQYYNDATPRNWYATSRAILPILTARGNTVASEFQWSVPNVPAGRQGATSQLIYAQADARTFGPLSADGTPNLNLLQVRPPVHNSTTVGELQSDLGDFQVRVNFLPTGGTYNCWPYPATYTYTGTHLNYETTGMVAFGQATKVPFPGANPSATPRQDLNAAGGQKPFFHHVGIPGDAQYKGTFPELNTASSPMNQRNNANAAGGGPSRASGTPRLLDLANVPLLGPIYPSNTTYRGTDSLVANSTWRTSLGDAWNYFLAKDIQNQGLRGLCLQRNHLFFHPSHHPDLAYDAAKTDYAVGDEAQSDNEIYQAQAVGQLPPPNPATNVGTGLAWKLSNGPYARARQFWQISWAEAVIGRLGLGGPKYKEKTGRNADTFKPGTVNLNTASKEVLKCLSLPTGANADAVADRIIACRQAPDAGKGVIGAGSDRQGLAFATEAFGPFTTPLSQDAGGVDATNLWSSLPAGKTNMDILSWLPQQASCRSDVFCAYILVQGYKADDFNKGPMDVRRKIAIFSRSTTGVATEIASTVVGGK